LKNVAKLFKEFPFFLGAPALLWQVLFLYLPLLFIVGISITQFSSTGEYEGLTLRHYVPFFTATYFRVIFRSLALAAINTLFCFLLAYPVAYFIVFRAKRFKTLFLFLLIVPFWVNFLLHVYAWFFLLERGGVVNRFLMWIGMIEQPLTLLNSQFAVSLGMLYCYLPFMALPIYSALERFDRRLIEASLDLGASPWETFRKVTFPVTYPGWQSGLFLVFIPSSAEFAIPALLGGDKHVFMGSVIAQYVLGSQTLPLGAAFTVICCVILVLCLSLTYHWVQKTFSYFRRGIA
jgi:spermidine/putrescine transport system permease protein